MKKIFLPLALCAHTALALAVTSVTGHVKDLAIQKEYGPFVFVQLDAAQTTPIACHTNAWTYTLPQATDLDKKMLALLMMAKATGTTVTMRGSGACSDFPSIESANGVDTYQ